MKNSKYARELVDFVQVHFKELADQTKAVGMAAYMKTEMPFYGIQNPQRLPVYREMKKRFPASSHKDYEAGILALWNLPHREEKYAALQFAQQNDSFVGIESIPLYESLIREGAWWDLVDEIAIRLSGRAQLKERTEVKSVMEKWIKDENLWVRRAALISQVGHKQKTDTKQLFKHCLLVAHEREFFMRKAIGWALRDYSWCDPDAVIKFLDENGDKLSPLTKREGAKRLISIGLLKSI
jgi:3-methyladenine DNA glycosylase AlkD